MITAASVAVVIVAAGRGARMGPGDPKQYRILGRQTILARTVDAFVQWGKTAAIQVVIHPDDYEAYVRAIEGRKILPPVKGGANRQASVRAGLEALATLKTPPDVVMIHDAARPFVSPALLDRLMAALDRPDGGVIPGLAVVDTLKHAPDGTIKGTISRDGLWRAQTPQVFGFDAILAAHRDCAGTDMTDDAAVAEAANMPVYLIEGTSENIKITTTDDLVTAQHSLAGATSMQTRTGMGFDVHRFEPGDHVTLCGIKIPHSAGLKGHSDADVGLHCLTDALLGALGDGDIGDHFPPSDPQWRGKDSAYFLEFACQRVRRRGGIINNLDLTLICERPRIGPHRDAMRTRIAGICAIAVDQVSVKATTTEQLGFTGRGEGIAGQAVATITLPASMTGHD